MLTFTPKNFTAIQSQNMNLKERIRSFAREYHADVVACRRHLHQNPELSFNEYETQKFVERKLDEFGITEHTRMANTGVVALIKGKNPGKRAIALRGDMDALPIQETNKKRICIEECRCDACMRS
jgi:metal-dependent amidase/aminoacylase/carboxypeptidase family protein